MRELEPFASTSEVIAWARQAAVVRREPRFLERNGTKWLLLPGDPENGEPGLSPPRYETRFALRDRQWRAVPSSTYNPAGGSR
jgi:hypothetical protein